MESRLHIEKYIYYTYLAVNKTFKEKIFSFYLFNKNDLGMVKVKISFSSSVVVSIEFEDTLHISIIKPELRSNIPPATEIRLKISPEPMSLLICSFFNLIN